MRNWQDDGVHEMGLITIECSGQPLFRMASKSKATASTFVGQPESVSRSSRSRSSQSESDSSDTASTAATSDSSRQSHRHRKSPSEARSVSAPSSTSQTKQCRPTPQPSTKATDFYGAGSAAGSSSQTLGSSARNDTPSGIVSTSDGRSSTHVSPGNRGALSDIAYSICLFQGLNSSRNRTRVSDVVQESTMPSSNAPRTHTVQHAIPHQSPQLQQMAPNHGRFEYSSSSVGPISRRPVLQGSANDSGAVSVVTNVTALDNAPNTAALFREAIRVGPSFSTSPLPPTLSSSSRPTQQSDNTSPNTPMSNATTANSDMMTLMSQVLKNQQDSMIAISNMDKRQKAIETVLKAVVQTISVSKHSDISQASTSNNMASDPIIIEGDEARGSASQLSAAVRSSRYDDNRIDVIIAALCDLNHEFHVSFCLEICSIEIQKFSYNSFDSRANRNLLIKDWPRSSLNWDNTHATLTTKRSGN